MSRFHEVREKASGNDPQNDSAVGKCNFPVPLIELAQGKLATEGSRRGEFDSAATSGGIGHSSRKSARLTIARRHRIEMLHVRV